MAKCQIDDCERPVKYAGLCGMHYKRKWRHGNPLTTLSVEPSIGCSVDGCQNKHSAYGMCNKHHLRYYRYGRTHSIVNRGSGWTRDALGYIRTWTGIRQVYEHIILAEQALGKPLPKGAIVHHTGAKDDNVGPFKLVICPNQAYHLLLHRRAKELGYEGI